MEAPPVHLVFPPPATTYLVSNDVASLTLHSITIADNAYGISGSGITLTGDLVANASGPSLDDLNVPVRLPNGFHLVNVSSTGTVLQIAGVITAVGDLSKSRAGSFRLSAS